MFPVERIREASRGKPALGGSLYCFSSLHLSRFSQLACLNAVVVGGRKISKFNTKRKVVIKAFLRVKR
jgi:hypothetical protein